jgi:hypothetical protein
MLLACSWLSTPHIPPAAIHRPSSRQVIVYRRRKPSQGYNSISIGGLRLEKNHAAWAGPNPHLATPLKCRGGGPNLRIACLHLTRISEAANDLGFKPRRGGLCIDTRAPQSPFCFWAARPSRAVAYARVSRWPRRPKTKSLAVGGCGLHTGYPSGVWAKANPAQIVPLLATTKWVTKMRVRYRVPHPLRESV